MPLLSSSWRFILNRPYKGKQPITNWETPQRFFDILNSEFNFTLDVCALPDNAKCKKYFTPDLDAMTQNWSEEIFWMNPPYGRGQDVYSWVKKAYDTAQAGGTGVCLLPASVDTRWFHKYCMRASEIRFVRDRLYFSKDGKSERANHASMIVIFRPRSSGPPRIMTMTNGHIRR
jgi:phage N-6-adenine-methyltransferase